MSITPIIISIKYNIPNNNSYTIIKKNYSVISFFQSLANYDAALSADLSTLFDVGGIAGAIAAGILSDYSGMSALTCGFMFILAIPMVSNNQ